MPFAATRFFGQCVGAPAFKDACFAGRHYPRFARFRTMNRLAESCTRSLPRAAWLPALLAGCWLVAGGGRAMAQKAPARLWELKLPTKCDSTPAIGTNGEIYFGNFDGQLWAVNTNGVRQWEFATGTEIWSSPAVAEDGTIYFGCRDRHFYAVTANGKKKWRFKTGGWVDASPAIGLDGTTFFGSWDKKFYAVDASGHERWRFATGGPIVSSAAIGTNGVIYFGSHDGKLYALSSEGREVWHFKTGGAILSSPGLDAAGRVLFTSVDGYLYALEPDGRLRWKLRTGSRNIGSPVVGRDGKIFVGLNDELWAVTPDGKQAWTGGKDDINSTPAIAADGTVLFMFEHGQLQGCDYERSLGSQWNSGVAYTGVASPALGDTGQLYILANWLLVTYAWEPPLAPVPWPKFRGNARNTGNQADWLK